MQRKEEEWIKKNNEVAGNNEERKIQSKYLVPHCPGDKTFNV